jgi:hypothetical protein
MDRREIAYLEVCRRVSLWLGVRLVGSSDLSGCTVVISGGPTADLPHWIVRRIAMQMGLDADASRKKAGP